MCKVINSFSFILLRLFNNISKSNCCGFYGEPDFPDELK
ncbi:MAG: cyclic lactone autoinducer peptide [Clostridium butyricum]|nr:cyclic lactone autoinducer peptide [Clostridium butyricum]MDU5821803.1 cyclic lactone autoinducer peptide [Clostridium butyricum]